MPRRVLSEHETRKNILEYAEHIGCKQEVIKIFEKYDRLLKNCTNQQERDAIAIMGNQELHRFISSEPGHLKIDGKIIT